MAQLPDWVNSSMKKRTVRSATNPMDKSTIVSIYPRKIVEMKHTIQPGKFVIEPGTYEKPSILIVGPSSWWAELHVDQPYVEINHGSTQVADSVVRDWAAGMLACDMDASMPGLFWIPGNYTEEGILKDPQIRPLLDKANKAQRVWFMELVKMGDILWSRSNGNPLSISDHMRMAAEQMQLQKPWMADFSTIKMDNCPACGTLRNNNFPVCNHCHHIVDIVLYEKLGLNKVG